LIDTTCRPAARSTSSTATEDSGSVLKKSNPMRIRTTVATLVVLLASVGGAAARPPAGFLVGAAAADVTPPAFSAAHHTPSIDPPGFDGPRAWDFTEPYVDQNHNAQWDPGEPYADLNHNGRYDGIYLGGGGGRDAKPPTKVADPVTARAFVVDNGAKRIAVEVLDTIGTGSDDLDAIRAMVHAQIGNALDDIFISSTHDESAPDVIGLWGPGLTPAGNGIGNSGVDDYWMTFMEARAAKAIVDAYRARRAATIRYAVAEQPANFLTCWSSYPYVRMTKIPVMQAVGTDGNTIFTLMNYGIHAETLGFNGAPVNDQKYWISADWPYWARRALEARYGGVGIQMASMVGSVETPKVFPDGTVSPVPTGQYDPGHPAGCRTIFATTGTPVPIGWNAETKAVGEGAAAAVIDALTTSATESRSRGIAFTRRTFFVPLTNGLFVAAGLGQVFPHRPLYVDGVEVPESSQLLADPAGTISTYHAPQPDTGGIEVRTEIVAYRIGDGEFLSNPGEGFPFSYIRGFQGPQDMPYPSDPMTAFVSPHFTARYHFVEGLGEDMIGYLFPKANAVGVPGDRPAEQLQQIVTSGGNDVFGDTDRFGCGHSDDSEATSGTAGNIVSDESIAALSALGGSTGAIVPGRWVWPDGSLHRNPLGEGTLGCNAATRAFARAPGAPKAAVVKIGGRVIMIPIGPHAAQFVDYDGFAEGTIPTVDTRGIRLRDGREIFLDVYPDERF
jgi:hypothetical protein